MKSEQAVFPFFETTKSRIIILLISLFLLGVNLGLGNYFLSIIQVIACIPLGLWLKEKTFE